MLDKTLGYILCCQSPGLFVLALLLLVEFLGSRRHKVRAFFRLLGCILCATGGVALYFVGMGAGYFTIQDFYAIRTPGWVGIGVVVIFNVWLIARGFLAVNRRRTAEKNANRAANRAANAAQQQREAEQRQSAIDASADIEGK